MTSVARDTVIEPSRVPGFGASADSQLSCTVLRNFSEAEPLRAAWDQAVLETGGAVYMTFDWLHIWWSFYGGSSQLRLFVFRSGDRLRAILPFYIDTLGGGPFQIRIARLVGANVPPKVFDLPVSAADAPFVFRTVFDQLLVADRCELMSVGPVSGAQATTKVLEHACRDGSGIVGRWTTTDGVHSVFHLPADIDQYFRSLSKNERKHRRKYELRALAKDHETRVEVVRNADQAVPEFERFAEQHRLQWAAEGRTGHFGAWPLGLEFNRALVAALSPLDRLRFIRIVADGATIANQYVFVLGDRFFWELPSREVDSGWDRFSLGPSAIVTMLSQAIDERMTRVEGGLAHYDYKVRLGATEYPTKTFRIVPHGLASQLRVAALLVVRGVMNVCYHKLWYRRIAPRLPETWWRPQWRWWLRLDV